MGRGARYDLRMPPGPSSRRAARIRLARAHPVHPPAGAAVHLELDPQLHERLVALAARRREAGVHAELPDMIAELLDRHEPSGETERIRRALPRLLPGDVPSLPEHGFRPHPRTPHALTVRLERHLLEKCADLLRAERARTGDDRLTVGELIVRTLRAELAHPSGKPGSWPRPA